MASMVCLVFEPVEASRGEILYPRLAIFQHSREFSLIIIVVKIQGVYIFLEYLILSRYESV